MRQKDPSHGSMEAFETWMAQEQAKRKNQKLTSTSVYNIPVIFHIIHNGESVGSGYNISAGQINAQIDQLNEDYRRIGNGYNTDSRGGDSYIEFFAATTDTLGNTLTEPGIDRINRNSKSWTAPPYGDCSSGFDPSYIENTIKPQSIWDPAQYMNVWIMDLNCGILGYAEMPATTATVTSQLPDMTGYGGSNSTDGVVLAYYTIGSACSPSIGAPYDLGRTATHEFGHFFGLRHIWGDATCGNDYCADTPTHEDYNWGVPTHPKSNSCGTTDEMFENYMDYTDDAVMNIFTANQISRMRIILDNSPRRVTLKTSTKCGASATYPKISFVEGCSNNTISVSEGTHNCGNYTTVPYTLHISRAPSSAVTVRVGYAGTATYGTDYYLSDTLFTFPSGTDATQTLNIFVRQDALVESSETILLSISSVSGGSAIKDDTRQSVSVTITNDDQTPQTAAGIQQSVDTISGYAEYEFGPNQTLYYRDQSSGSIILSLTNTSTHNFGCTHVEVIRSGTGASRAWTPNPTDYITSKTFRIIPQYNNTTTASYNISLYYTEAEIAGWESVTGNSRTDIQLVKTSGYIAQIDPPSSPEYGFATHSTFGASGHIYTASFTSGFSSFGLGKFSSLLPVEWISFTAEPKTDHIQLNWKTASETPGTSYEIQRSTDPHNGFETLGSINGNGTTSRVSEYFYQDYSAEPNILYYYRVQHADPIGKSKLSDIRMAKLIASEKISYTVNPTLFTGGFTVQCDPSGNGMRRLQVFDMMGNIVIDEELPNDYVSKSIDTYTWTRGLYILNITDNNQVVFTKKIQKGM